MRAARGLVRLTPLLTHWFFCQPSMHSYQVSARGAALAVVNKAALAQADACGTRLTRAFSGRPARALVNGFMQAMRADEATLPAYPVQNALTGELRGAAARAGDLEAMSLWAGQGASLARPGSVEGLVARLVREYDAAAAVVDGQRRARGRR